MFVSFPLWMVLLASSCSAATVCDLKSDGSAGSVKNETGVFQPAIDDCASHGGGTVRVGPGSHRIGPLALKSNVSYCDHVLVEGVTLLNSPSYTLVPYFSTDVTVRGIKILAPPDSPNTDGVAPYTSHRVRISDATIDTGDDNVAIKSSHSTDPGVDSSCSDATVGNSTFLHGHGATIGADTGGGVRFHDITLERVKAEGGKSAGLVIGLPETPIANFVMQDVEISAGQGLTVRNAAVVLRESHIRPQSGPAIIREQNAQVDEGEPNKEKSGAR